MNLPILPHYEILPPPADINTTDHYTPFQKEQGSDPAT